MQQEENFSEPGDTEPPLEMEAETPVAPEHIETEHDFDELPDVTQL